MIAAFVLDAACVTLRSAEGYVRGTPIVAAGSARDGKCANSSHPDADPRQGLLMDDREWLGVSAHRLYAEDLDGGNQWVAGDRGEVDVEIAV